MNAPRRVAVNDLMQQGYVYLLTEPMGGNFHPDFHPELTPKEMLALGVFGGKYMTDCREEFPADWFVGARLNHERHAPELNFYGVNASQSLAEWRRKGWISWCMGSTRRPTIGLAKPNRGWITPPRWRKNWH